MNSLWEITLRSLLPSWRFFEDLHEIPLVSYRLDNLSADWIPCFPPIARSSLAVFFNPSGNRRLATLSIAEQFLIELEAGRKDPPSAWASYQMLDRSIVLELIRLKLSGTLNLQFRILSSSPGRDEGESQAVLFTSEWHKVEL
ncbi:MAG: hypothetical protein EOP09_06400 [Proteobacteria bacterium]|nr:MAG: hypothetical protein EOP09_06400 [Pseudomonadota bacterium]